MCDHKWEYFDYDRVRVCSECERRETERDGTLKEEGGYILVGKKGKELADKIRERVNNA